MHVVQPFPIEAAYIYFKTLEWKENAIDSFEDLETAMFIRESEAPFCEVVANGIEDLSLSGMCGGEVNSTTNVAYYIRAVFPNVYDGAQWCFRLPARFSRGGFVLYDGQVVSGKDKNTEDLGFCLENTKGMHIMEVYGVSKYDDVMIGSWAF